MQLLPETQLGQRGQMRPGIMGVGQALLNTLSKTKGWSERLQGNLFGRLQGFPVCGIIRDTHLLFCEILLSAHQVGSDEALPRPDLAHEAIETEVEDQELPAGVWEGVGGLLFRVLSLSRHRAPTSL